MIEWYVESRRKWRQRGGKYFIGFFADPSEKESVV